MTPGFEIADALTLTLRLCAAGIVVQSLEILMHRAELAPDGLLGWKSAPSENGRTTLASHVNGHGGSVALLASRALVALGVVFLPWASPATFWAVSALLLLQLAFNRRFLILAGNCETMFLVELFALAAAALPGASERLRSAALLFIAAHAALAYLVAGLHKLGSAPWRSGARLRQIVQHGSYELPEFFARLLRPCGTAAVATWAVIALELLLPFAPFLPPPIFWALLAAGFAFHTAIAFLMGLHGFWWSFAASYPALVFVHAGIAEFG